MAPPSQDAADSREKLEDFTFFAVVRRSRVMVLLAALLLQIALAPLTDQVPLLDTMIQIGLVLAAIYTAADSRRHLRVGLALGIPSVIFNTIFLATGNVSWGWAAYFMALLLYAHVIKLLLAHIFRAKAVTLDIIGMALCTYVLLGALWTLFYLPVLTLNPEAFSFNVAPQPGENTAVLTYFSYVTLTTLGYGDISPVSQVARTLAILEALTGTLFLAVLISRLVGTYSAGRKSG
jgi:voltage-gated potassium channel